MNLLEKYQRKLAATRIDFQKVEHINADRAAYRVFSEILQVFLWVVETDQDMHTLRGQGITEAVYTNKEIRVLKKLHKDDLQRVQAAKEIFPNAVVEEVINVSMKGE